MPSAFIYNQTTGMKKKRITYGVFGMMEYQSIIKIGRATLKVLFTDGSITSLGQNPAQYTTSDFLVQHAIENSSDFKRGRIKVVNSIELGEDVRIERNHAASTQATPAKTAANVEAPPESASPAKEEAAVTDVAETKEDAVAETTSDEAETTTEAVPEAAEAVPEAAEAVPEAAEEAEDKAAEETAAKTEVEFSTNQEAKDYLANTFGVKGALKTRAEIIAAGETYGVKITFVDN